MAVRSRRERRINYRLTSTIYSSGTENYSGRIGGSKTQAFTYFWVRAPPPPCCVGYYVPVTGSINPLTNSLVDTTSPSASIAAILTHLDTAYAKIDSPLISYTSLISTKRSLIPSDH